VRAAALAAVLVPLASVAAAPAEAADCVTSGGTFCTVSGTVWSDGNNNGIQDSGELGIPGVSVTLNGTTVVTDSSGSYTFLLVPVGTYDITVQTPPGTQTSPTGVGSDDTIDSDGVQNGTTSVASVTVSTTGTNDADFGFTSDQLSDGAIPSPCDFTTSGGFVIGDEGKKVTFGIHGGCKHGEFWGHLNVVDHATGSHINSTDITAYIVPDGATSNTREICGIASTNKSTDPSTIMFRVRLMDNGEPGSSDRWGIRTSTGYHVSTRLLSDIKPGGGNIQLHDGNPSTDEAPATFNCFGLAPLEP
jgi:hypothetical protein